MGNRTVYFFIFFLVLVGFFLGGVAAAHATLEKRDTYRIETVDAAILDALEERGISGDVALEQLYVQPEGTHKGAPFDKADQLGITYLLKLEDIQLQERSSRFVATFSRVEYADASASIDAPVRPALPVSRIDVRGRYVEMAEVPVLVDRLRNGDVITQKDVQFISVPKQRIKNSTVTELSKLIGQTPRRSIDGGEIIRITDVEAPTLVKRGNLIAVFYRNGKMELRDMGIAMRDGAAGEIIEVKNARSNTVVQAQVSAPNTAVVNYWQPTARN